MRQTHFLQNASQIRTGQDKWCYGFYGFWVTKLQFVKNIPMLLCSQSLKLHKAYVILSCLEAHIVLCHATTKSCLQLSRVRRLPIAFHAVYFLDAYCLVQLLAFLRNSFLSSLNSFPIDASTASSGCGSASNCCANLSTSPILELGFHSSGRSMPRHMVPFSSLVTFG